MKPPKVVDLRAIREEQRVAAITQTDAHVRVTVEGWYLGAGRWYYQPVTTSRMGDLTPGGYAALGGVVREYGEELERYAGARVRVGRGRRAKIRRGW